VNCQHCRRTWFCWKNVRISQSVPFSKCKNETKEEVLSKSKSLVKVFKVVFLGVLYYKVHSFNVYKKKLAKSFNILMRKRFFMNGCMYALLC